MARINRDMKGALGRLGDKTYYRFNGKTIARSIVTPKNPKSVAQTLQRVLHKAVIGTYRELKPVCSQCFEGYGTAFQSMNRFKTVNLRYLREHAETLQHTGQGLERFYQFAPIESERWTPFAAIISEGHLPEIKVGFDADRGNVAYVSSPGPTYADFVTAWGLWRRDVVTFVTVQKREGRYGANFARLVLNPRYADGSGAPMTTEIVDSAGEFPFSHWGNELNFSAFRFDTDRFNFVLGRGGDVVAAGIIVSRMEEGSAGEDGEERWFHSNCQLLLNDTAFGSDLCSLAKAIKTSYVVPDVDIESEFYLNNAGGGDSGDSDE